MTVISIGFLHTFPFAFSSLFISPVLFFALLNLSHPSLPLALNLVFSVFSCFWLTVLSLKPCSFPTAHFSWSGPSPSPTLAIPIPIPAAPAGRALCDSQLSHVNGCLIKPLESHIQEQDNHVVVDCLSSLVWELRLAQPTESFFMHLDIKDWEIWEYGLLWLFFCLTRPHHATGNFKEFLWAVTWILVLLFTPHSKPVVNQRKVHTYLLGW